MFFSTAYLNKAAAQKFLTQHIQFLRIPGAGVCFNYNLYQKQSRYWHLTHRVMVVARGSLSLFSSPFCITQTSLFLKRIFEGAKVRVFLIFSMMDIDAANSDFELHNYYYIFSTTH
jgi:hypothetical protein